MATIKGTGVVATGDYKAVTWTGKTKGGKAVTISFPKAINLGNIDWTFAEKDDTVAEVTFTAVYSNTDAMVASAADMAEPFTITYTPGESDGAASEIMLGAGILSINGTDVALTRGGGQFTVEREFREINADGDRGPVEGRIVMDASRATLRVNALQILTRMGDLYAAISTT